MIKSVKSGWIRKMLIAGLAILVVIVVHLCLTRAEPVLYRFVEAGRPDQMPEVTIFNPFRDRRPEKSAESFLELLKEGQCERAMAVLPLDMESRRTTCEKEGVYSLESWNLKDRTDLPKKVKIYFTVKRKEYGDYQSQVWVTVEERDSQWQVTEFESWY
jgi:hypothetical protein